MDKGINRAVSLWHRRAGKDKTLINLIAKKMQERVGTYYYFFPTYNQGKKILWLGRDRDGFKFTDHIPEALRTRTNESELMIETKNGSIFQIVGTDNIDSIVGTNPIGCVFSEYSLQNPNAWRFIRPILAENGGWAVFNYCVAKDTVILSETGMQRIERQTNKEFTDINENIYGLGGMHKAEQFYSGGKKNVLTITTKRGYTLTCTPNHPIWDGREWKKSEDWNMGDSIPIQRGQNVWGNYIPTFIKPEKRKSQKDLPDNFIDTDFMYLMGLYLAEGNVSQNSVTITNFDKEIQVFLEKNGFKEYNEGHYTRCSMELVHFIKQFGMSGLAKEKELPEQLMQMEEKYVSAFLSGYFDGDGSALKRGRIKATSASKKLLQRLQVLLLNYGIISSLTKHITKPTEKVKKECIGYDLEFDGYNAYLFYKKIGFRLKRKQERESTLKNRDFYGDVVDIDPKIMEEYSKGMNETDLKRHSKIRYRTLKRLLKKKKNKKLEKILEDNFYYDKIVSIEKGEAEVYDFVIPETHSFFTNGFISHNTPRGKNHGYDIYNLAKKSKDWFCELITVDDTHAIPQSVLEQEKAEIIQDTGDDALFLQEYYCSFEAPMQGSYYGKEMTRADEEGRIGNVPHDPALLVDTWWDLGMKDSTVIWFTQEIGHEIRVINCYENSGESLAHYIAHLQELSRKEGYTYRYHNAPHDIQVRELGSGKSRYETAMSLGIDFFTVPNIPVLDGIDAVRNILKRCWFDEKNCSRGISALRSYHKEWDEKNMQYKAKPKHDWASDFADSFRMFAVGHIDEQRTTKSEREEDMNEPFDRFSLI